MSPQKKQILLDFYIPQKLTALQYLCLRDVTDRGKQANKLRALEYHIKWLVDNGYLLPVWTPKTGKARERYLSLTKKGLGSISREKKPINFEVNKQNNFKHQYGLQTSFISYYKNNRERVIDAIYNPPKDLIGYLCDLVVVLNTGAYYIFEFENNTGFNEFKRKIKQRAKSVKQLPKGSKFIYVSNCTRDQGSFNIADTLDPVYFHSMRWKEEQRVRDFLNDLLNDSFIKSLPAHEYRFSVLSDFPKFGEAVWYAPGNKQALKI